MHHALWLLTRLRLNASWRRLLQTAKTIRGALLLLFTIGFLSLMLVPALIASFVREIPTGNLIDVYGPFVLLLYVLTLLLFSVGDRSIHFSPSEVDFLFPAPFTRKQLLAYKVINNVASIVFVSLIFCVANRGQYHIWIAGLVGFFLTFTFLQLVSILTGLIGQSVSGRAYTRGRRIIAISFIATLAVAASQAMTQWQRTEYSEIPQLIETSTIGRIVLTPFRVLCNVIMAERVFPDLFGWATAAATMIVVTVACIFRLDADYSDVAIRTSKLRYERLHRFQRGEVIFSNGKPRTTRIPMLPFLYGSGPLIWRQLVRTSRTLHLMMRFGLIVSLAMAIPLFMQFRRSPQINPYIPLMILGAIAYLSMLIAAGLPMGFRADIDRIEVFRNLPVSTGAVVLAQLLGTTLMITLMHWLLFLGLTILLPMFWVHWLLGACVSPIFNLLLFSIAHGLFLFFPIRVAAGANADFQTGMKNFMMIMLQYLLIAVALAVVGVPAAIGYLATQSLTVAALIAFVLLVAECGLGVLFVWTAYVRFDVAKHLPA